MGLSGKWLGWLFLVMVVWVPNAQAVSHDVTTLPMFQGKGAKEDYYKTILDPKFKECHSTSCQALRDVGEVFELVLDRMFPNSMARLDPLPDDWDKMQSRKIDKILHTDRKRWKFYCQISKEIARSITSWGNWQRGMADTIIEVVHRTSANSNCTKELIEIFPDNADIKDIIQYAKGVCINDNRSRCSEIRKDSISH